ncbi:MAG: hypothetical protein HG439_004705 [candidate division SR1 bacterium]|nr:hypothetical protein [candidate division SR1 bacterium]
MASWIKIALISGLLALGLTLPFTDTFATNQAPSFETHYAKPMVNGTPDQKGRSEKVFDIACVSKTNTFKENVECLFFPKATAAKGAVAGGYLRSIIKYVGYILVFIYLVMSAIRLVISGKKSENLKAELNNFLYIMIGAALFFGAVWLFSQVINLSAIDQTTGLKDNLVSNTGILFFVLTFLKGAAFFLAIVMIVITGFQMMNPSSGEEGGGKKLFKNLAAVIAALVGMKVVDFLYYIASQQDFTKRAGEFIIQIAKMLGYISGSVIVIMIIYSGYLLVVDGGKGENFKKAKNTLINIVLAVGSLFLFLFVIYQIFSEFGA